MLLAEMTTKPDGAVRFVEGAGEAEGKMTALDVPSNDEGKRVLLAKGKGKPETMILSVDIAGGKVVENLVLLAEGVGDPEGKFVLFELEAKKVVMFVNSVGGAEGTITTLEADKLELAGKKTVGKFVSDSSGVEISKKVLVVSGTAVLMVTVVMPVVTVYLYLVVVSLDLAVRVLVCRRFR